MQSSCMFHAHVSDCSLAACREDIVARFPFLHRWCPSLCVYSFAGNHIEMMKEITLSITIRLSVSRAIRASAFGLFRLV